MSGNNEGIIVILSSPSGAGKTTLVKEISKRNNFQISISHTTRKPRLNETDGKDYFFVSKTQFKNLIDENKFLEYAKVFNNFYGSSKDIVFEHLNKGENIIFDIDWQGTQQIKNQKLNYEIITIFILPPSREELYNRLLNRDKNNNDIAMQRMKQFNDDVLHWNDYDLVVINDNLNNCYNNIIKFIKSTNRKNDPNIKKLISKHVDKLLN
mgnify:CR=1 FL=1